MRGEKLHSYLLRRPQSLYADAIRSLLLNVQLSQGDRKARVILVTSAIPGEGKTTLAMSLGAQAASLGERTVVVDFDLRHPNIARELGRPVEVGLAEYFSAQALLDDIICVDPNEARLHVIPLRAPVQNASRAMQPLDLEAFIGELRSRYDTVILDLPPSLAISDIRAVGPLADVALFVVRWGKTTGSAARNGLESLGRVLN